MDIKNVDLFFSENPNPMWIYNPSDLSIQEVNQSAVELYGYSRSEMRSMTIDQLRPASEVETLKKHRDPEPDNTGVWHHQKKDGDDLFVRMLTSSISYEGNNYNLVAVQNVTSKIDYQQKYEMLFENSLDGIMLTAPNGDILQANKAACKILGMTEQEITSKGREGIVAKDEKLEQALEERSETGKFSGELTYIHKSGRPIPVELTTSVFTNHKGEERTNLIFRDISKRKETEEALRYEKEFNDITLKSLPGVFFVLNEQGEVIKWNAHSKDVFGLTDEEIGGQPAEAFVHDDDKELIRQSMAKVFEKGYTRVELKLHTAGDNTAIYDFIANKFQQNDLTYIVGSGVDVTKQKDLEKKLQVSLHEEHSERLQAEAGRDKLKEMFEEAPSPKCLLEGPEMRFVIANKAYRELIGQDNIIGKRVIDVIPEVQQQGYIDILNHVYEKGEQYVGHGEPIYFDKEKEGAQREYILNFIYKPLVDDNGEVYGIFVEAMDFSEEIAYQKKLEESLKEKETLLYEIHHRVKNNLAIVSSMMELQSLDSENAALQDALRVSQQRIQAIASIHELLYQSNQLSHLDFGATVEKIIEKLKDVYGIGNNISLQMQIEPVKLNVNQAIPCGLIINELVTNAYKHAFENLDNGKIEVHLAEDRYQVHLTIKDNGVGLPKEFDTENTSTIGMTLVNLLQKQLDADLNIKSEEGTHFSLTFEKTEVKGIGSAIIE